MAIIDPLVHVAFAENMAAAIVSHLGVLDRDKKLRAKIKAAIDEHLEMNYCDWAERQWEFERSKFARYKRRGGPHAGGPFDDAYTNERFTEWGII
jgi:hypothetical protein